MATLILGVALLSSGIKQFIYFFSMGIHMIGGKMILYRALITLDLSFFILSVTHASECRGLRQYGP